MPSVEELQRQVDELKRRLGVLAKHLAFPSEGFIIGDTRVYREEDDGHLWQRERDGTETDLAGPKVNYSAIIPPTVNDDAGDGYSISSRWIDIVGQKEYVCVDATTGAAVWIETTTDEPGGIHTHALLQASMHTDTLNQSPSLGSLVAATAAKWTEFPAGPNGTVLVPASGETLGVKYATGLAITDTTGTWTLTAIGTNQAGYLYLKPIGTPGANPHAAFRVYNQAGQYAELRAETGGLYVVSSGAQNLLLGVGTKYAFQIDTNGDVAMAYHSLSNIGPYLHVYTTGEAVQYDPPLHGLQLEANATTGVEKRNSGYAKFTGHYSANAAVNILEFLRVLTTDPTYELVWHNLTTTADLMRLGQTGILYLDTIAEQTAAAGVTIDGTLIKDNAIYPLSTNLNCYFKWVAAAGGNFYFQADSGDYILYNATLNKWYFDINSTEILGLLSTGATLSVPLAMSSKKITGLAAASANGDAVRYEQLPAAASATVQGIVELATAAETTTGTDDTRAVTPDGLAGSDYGKRVMYIKEVVAAATALTTGDAKTTIVIPSELNGWNLVNAQARVYTVATGATLVTIQIRNVTDGHDMLSTKITIDASELTSYTAATASVIDTAEDDVVTADIIAIDIDAIGNTTPGNGLDVILTWQLP